MLYAQFSSKTQKKMNSISNVEKLKLRFIFLSRLCDLRIAICWYFVQTSICHFLLCMLCFVFGSMVLIIFIWRILLDSMRLKHCVWSIASEASRLTLWVWRYAFDAMRLTHCVWMPASESLSLNHWVWNIASAALCAKHCVKRVASDTLRLTRYVWRVVFDA